MKTAALLCMVLAIMNMLVGIVVYIAYQDPNLLSMMRESAATSVMAVMIYSTFNSKGDPDVKT